MRKVDILGVKFDNIDIVEAVEHAVRVMDARSGAYMLAPDYEAVLAARNDRRLRLAMNGAEMVLPAGSGIIAASHILGSPLMQEISGGVFASALLARMSDGGRTVHLVGSGAEIEKASAAMERRYPGIRVLGYSDVRLFTDEHIAAAIREESPDLVLAGLEPVSQELWIAANVKELGAGLVVGLGNVLRDYAAEPVPAARRYKTALLDYPGVVAASVFQRLTGSV